MAKYTLIQNARIVGSSREATRDADLVLDPEKAMKRPFTNEDAVAVRKKVARWICELD